jgi:hypothetical protein
VAVDARRLEDAQRGGRRERRAPWGLISLVAVALLLFTGTGRGLLGELLPSFPNPFATETVDRTPPAVLESIRDLHQYRAATGQFQVMVDVEQDTKLPAVLLGEHTLLSATGSVDAIVDFSRLGPAAVTVSADRRSAVVRLPAPALTKPRLDLANTSVVSRERGVLNEVGDLFRDERNGERGAYLLAERKIEAAARSTALVERAQANTRTTIAALLRSLGFTRVDVRFGADPRRLH